MAPARATVASRTGRRPYHCAGRRFHTVGGFVFHTLGRLLGLGETVEAHGVRVRVEKVSDRRTLRVRLQKLDGGAPRRAA